MIAATAAVFTAVAHHQGRITAQSNLSLQPASAVLRAKAVSATFKLLEPSNAMVRLGLR